MIRIVFDDGQLVDCEHIHKIYVEQYELDKVTVVGKLEEETYVRISDSGDAKPIEDN